jgi:hypothetical protein
MGILKSAADLVYTIRFLKLLTTPFEETDAFKAGIIDENGKKRKDFSVNSLENREALKDYYTAFHRLVFNVKRLMAKAPGGSSRIASYAAALYLIKESGQLSDKNIEKIHSETGIDILDMLAEESQWFIVEGNKLSPGVYRMLNDSMTNSYAEVVFKGDQIRILPENNSTVGEIFGVNIYEAVHLKSQQRLYISTGEITR